MTINPISMSWRANMFRLRMPRAASKPAKARKSIGALVPVDSDAEVRLSARPWPSPSRLPHAHIDAASHSTSSDRFGVGASLSLGDAFADQLQALDVAEDRVLGRID